MNFKKFNSLRSKMGLTPITSRYSDNKLNSKRSFIFIAVQSFDILDMDDVFADPESNCYKLRPTSGRFMYDLATSIDTKRVAQNKGHNFIFSDFSFASYNFKFVHDDISIIGITDDILAFYYGNLDDSLTFDTITDKLSNAYLNKLAVKCKPTKYELYRLIAEYTTDPVTITSLSNV